MTDILTHYFPELTAGKREAFRAMEREYPIWNARINVVSRRDIDNLVVHHLLHSLAIARFMTPPPGATFVDLGTGGGFPGLPLAVLWPECRFHLIDRVAKKLTVARAVAEAAGLTNVTLQHGDAGECRERFDYVVSRAVMSLPALVQASAHMVTRRGRPGALAQGLICLKGGDLSEELAAVRRPYVEVPISDWFQEEYFATKRLIYVKI